MQNKNDLFTTQIFLKDFQVDFRKQVQVLCVGMGIDLRFSFSILMFELQYLRLILWKFYLTWYG